MTLKPPRPTSRKVPIPMPDRKSTRLNSSHANISYAVFCLKKKKDCSYLPHPPPPPPPPAPPPHPPPPPPPLPPPPPPPPPPPATAAPPRPPRLPPPRPRPH